jgi:HTH-type transcriptional regulator/antitoxin HigA
MVLTPSFTKHWQAVKSVFSIRNEAEYEAAIEHLNELLDVVGTDESHPLYSMLDTLGTLIHSYEEQHEVQPEAGGKDVLAYLMEEHGLHQSDLPEIGSQGVVSEILSGKRELNVRQIRALSKRFAVSPAVFI